MVWDPHQIGLIKSLEKVQKFSLRMATRNWNLDYDSLLGACDIQILQTRGHNLKLCFLFQFLNGYLSFPNAPLVSRPTLHLRNSNPHLLVQPVVHSKAHQFSFFPHSHSGISCQTRYTTVRLCPHLSSTCVPKLRASN